jgi:hypothetical protein
MKFGLATVGSWLGCFGSNPQISQKIVTVHGCDGLTPPSERVGGQIYFAQVKCGKKALNYMFVIWIKIAKRLTIASDPKRQSRRYYLRLRWRDCFICDVAACQKKRPPESAAFVISWQPIRDTLRNFLLAPPAEMLSFLQQLREAL